MSGLFAVLLLISTIVFIVGLAKPVINKKTGKPFRRRDLAIGLGSLVVVFFVLTGITAPKTNTVATENTSSKTAPSTKTIKSNTSNKPVITTKTTTSTNSIPYTSSTVQDASLTKGTTETQTKGVNGVQTQTWLATYSNGVQTNKKLISTITTTSPINEVIEQGTYVAPAPTPTPTPTPTPAPASTPSTGCHPQTDSGGCYEPGEYCRDSDQGASGVAGDGESITCEDNNGLRWEPS
jgi:hypothetical protein